MVLARWTPFDLAGDSFDDIVRRTFGDFGSNLLTQRAAPAHDWAPALDAYVDGDELHVKLEVPGIDASKDVEIEVENGVLRISGERREEQTKEVEGWFRREMRYGRFERRIALPEGVDAENVRASYDAGVLDVAIPIPAKPKTKVKVAIADSSE